MSCCKWVDTDLRCRGLAADQSFILVPLRLHLAKARTAHEATFFFDHRARRLVRLVSLRVRAFPD